jgi:hypothetical protein
MPAKRELNMRQLRHLLRLHHGGVGAREIGRRLGVARSTIEDNLKRSAAGLAWPLAEDVTDDALEQLLFGRAGCAGPAAYTSLSAELVLERNQRFRAESGQLHVTK